MQLDFSSGVNSPQTTSQQVGFTVGVEVELVTVETVPEVLREDFSKVTDENSSELVDSPVEELSDSEDSGTVVLDSSPEMVVSGVVPESVVVVTSAEIVTSVVAPPAVKVVTVSSMESVIKVESRDTLTTEDDLLRDTISVVLYVRLTTDESA